MLSLPGLALPGRAGWRGGPLRVEPGEVGLQSPDEVADSTTEVREREIQAEVERG